jgi:hypothetical protein
LRCCVRLPMVERMRACAVDVQWSTSEGRFQQCSAPCPPKNWVSAGAHRQNPLHSRSQTHIRNNMDATFNDDSHTLTQVVVGAMDWARCRKHETTTRSTGSDQLDTPRHVPLPEFRASDNEEQAHIFLHMVIFVAKGYSNSYSQVVRSYHSRHHLHHCGCATRTPRLRLRQPSFQRILGYDIIKAEPIHLSNALGASSVN